MKSAEILSHYDPEFGNRRIFGYYLRTLIEAWIRDLAYHWKPDTPPGREEVASIGLLARLGDGTTQKEVRLGGNPLHRD